MKLPFPWLLKYALLLIARYTVCLLSGHRWFYGDYKALLSKRVCFRCRDGEIADYSWDFRHKVLNIEEAIQREIFNNPAQTHQSAFRKIPNPGWPLFKDTKPEDLWLN